MSADDDSRLDRLFAALTELNAALAAFTTDELVRIQAATAREMTKRGLLTPGPSVSPTPEGPGPEPWEMR